MFKKVSFFLLLSVLNCSIVQADISQTDVPQSIIFLWDFHHVIVKPHNKLSALKHYPYKKRALSKTVVRHKFIKYAIKSRFKEVSSETFINLGNKYNDPYFTQMIIEISAAQNPMVETVEIIHELAQNGYTHHLGSNMGLTVFQAITDEKKYPQFKDIFNYFDLEKSQVITLGTEKMKKPDTRFFLQYIEKNNIDLKKTRVIFIDNKKANARAACKAGLEGIQFKNATQLRRDLAQKGVNIKII